MTDAATACTQAACDGVIEDGYCDDCGHAAAASVVAPPTVPPGPTGHPAPHHPTPDHPTPDRASGWALVTQQVPVGRRGTGRSARATGSGSMRARLGAGLVDVPAVPRIDPTKALLTDPQVPENRRFCSRCGHPVGRSRGDRPGRTEGYCPEDGTSFSFTPKLGPGTLVGGQYDVRGCLAHGGLGWVYLATDRNVDDRWVVLKGLLDSDDDHAQSVVIAEKSFLAQVDHPGIVTIHNFVEHHDRAGRPMGFIVMEYVGGSTLRAIMEQNRRPDGTLTPMPLARALAYALEVLSPLGYLHGLGLAYCDFKPDNVIQYDRQLKLIDLGAVIRFDDDKSPVFGTVGYQAPEIATSGPSPATDIHTVGRTLAVLALGRGPASGGRLAPLPDDHPVLRRHESFHRLLLRATDPDPDFRFATVDEFGDQLSGVLREVLSVEDGQPRPALSTVFSAPRGSFAAELHGSGAPGRPDPRQVAAALPMPLADRAAAPLGAAGRDELARLLEATPHPGADLLLALARAELSAGDPAAATRHLDVLAAQDPQDWRLDWYRGGVALFGDPAAGVAAFDSAYTVHPGEVAPKLALAAAAECLGDDARARRYYALLARTEPSLADAAFGLARTALRAGDRPAAIAALAALPDTSSRHVAAQLAAIDATLAGRSGTEVGEHELRATAARFGALSLDAQTTQSVRCALFTAAVELVTARGGPPPSAPPILDTAWLERDLRLALEGSLRACARLTSSAAQRVAFIDRANAERPRTWT